ncbi:putative odorant receptor 69a [Onthophagus taurus]|uniref:putative odorant receptor 69a n=1 Tax=Onthophagus taurus TaxID=166361 RepID=UPI0039BE4C7D
MANILGFYIVEKYFRKNHFWPTSTGFRGLAPFTLIIINILWGIYSLIIEITNFKANCIKLLFYVEFILLASLCLWGNLELVRNKRHLLNMIDLLSDFNEFGVPERIQFVDKILKIILKSINYGGSFVVHLASYLVMFQDDCVIDQNFKNCLVHQFYVPLKLNHWEVTLIMLFQIYSFTIMMIIMLFGIVLYWYSVELLVIRINNLNEMLDNITLTKNKKMNYKVLRPLIMYHQKIVRMFRFASSYYVRYLVPIKVCCSLVLTTSITEFVITKDLINLIIIIANFLGILICYSIAERFTTLANTVSIAIYNLNWFDADVSTRHDVLLLLTTCQKPLVIQTPLFMAVSHVAVAQDYKRVYIFCNWILKVTN